MSTFRDLTDKVFGRLTVVGLGVKTRSGNYKWHCRCDCGTQKSVPAGHLLRQIQPVESCGCLRNDRVRLACSPDPNEVAFRLLIGSYKKRAKLRGFEFSLTADRFREITSASCRYCGAAPEMVIENRPKTGRYVYSSIDRRDQAFGYTESNSVPCCKICNYMKWTLSEEEFIRRAIVIASKEQAR